MCIRDSTHTHFALYFTLPHSSSMLYSTWTFIFLSPVTLFYFLSSTFTMHFWISTSYLVPHHLLHTHPLHLLHPRSPKSLLVTYTLSTISFAFPFCWITFLLFILCSLFLHPSQISPSLTLLPFSHTILICLTTQFLCAVCYHRSSCYLSYLLSTFSYTLILSLMFSGMTFFSGSPQESCASPPTTLTYFMPLFHLEC